MRYLHGKAFDIGAFIMLAIPALIRKILIYSLSADKGHQLMVIGGVLLSLALAYWLVEHALRKRESE